MANVNEAATAMRDGHIDLIKLMMKSYLEHLASIGLGGKAMDLAQHILETFVLKLIIEMRATEVRAFDSPEAFKNYHDEWDAFEESMKGTCNEEPEKNREDSTEDPT